MNARARVIEGLGGRCAFCGSTTRPLEIDHITDVTGPGTAHRKAIGKKLEYWLQDQYRADGKWPAGYQLLCVTPERTGCHDLKSQRRRMATTKETKQLNITVSPEKFHQVEQLAQDPRYGSKAKVVEAALDALLGSQMDEMALSNLQQQLAAMQAALLIAIHDNRPSAAQDAPSLDLKAIEHRLAATLKEQLEYVRQEITLGYQTFESRLPPRSTLGPRPAPSKGLSRRLLAFSRTFLGRYPVHTQGVSHNQNHKPLETS